MSGQSIKNDEYYFHQTPVELAKELMNHITIDDNDIVYEPFKGEGAFYNNFAENSIKIWSEITEGRDYKDRIDKVQWTISNPPYNMVDENGKKIRSGFYKLLIHFLNLSTKGVAFLINDSCFSSLSPNRLELINNMGWYITNIIICDIQKWYGRYFFVIFKKEKNHFVKYIKGTY
jgi:hypothetical protein